MSKLLPWLKVKMSPANIETLDLEVVPEKSGAYVMLSTRTDYPYPKSNSRVYYIGQDENLRQRLAQHQRWCRAPIDEPPKPDWHYFRRYEYAAYHGCNVVWLVSKTPQDKERELLWDFADFYGAKPVASG